MTNRRVPILLLLLSAIPMAEAAVQQRLTVNRDLVYAEHDRGTLDVYVLGGATDTIVDLPPQSLGLLDSLVHSRADRHVRKVASGWSGLLNPMDDVRIGEFSHLYFVTSR